MNNMDNTPKAIILMLFGMSVFAIQDALIKIISTETNLFFIYFSRSVIGGLILFLYLYIKKEPIVFKTHYPKLTILRGVLFFISFSLYYFSLTKLSLAKAITLFFVSPFFITIISIILLKEVVGIKRWGAIIIGFIGVYLVMEPDFNNFDYYSTFPILCAFGYALTMVIQKITSDKDNLYSQTFHLFLAAIFFSTIIGFISGDGKFYDQNYPEYSFLLIEWSLSLNILMIFLIIGIVTVIGFLCIFQAYRIGSPPSVAPFEYIIILWGLVITWFVWEDTLSTYAYIGLVLIVLAGIYTFIRESRKKSNVTFSKPLR